MLAHPIRRLDEIVQRLHGDAQFGLRTARRVGRAPSVLYLIRFTFTVCCQLPTAHSPLPSSDPWLLTPGS